MKKLLIILGMVALGLSGCHKEKSFSKVYNFDNNTWQRFDFLHFDFDIEKTDTPYDVVVVVRYTEDFPSQNLLFNLVMNMPSGEERIREYKIKIRDKEGNLMGETKAGYHEQYKTIRRQLRFSETGHLGFEIENLMTKYYTPGVVEFGMVLEPSE